MLFYPAEINRTDLPILQKYSKMVYKCQKHEWYSNGAIRAHTKTKRL